MEIERKLGAAGRPSTPSSAQRHQNATPPLAMGAGDGRLLQELRQSQDKTRSQFDLIVDLEKRLNEAVCPQAAATKSEIAFPAGVCYTNPGKESAWRIPCRTE